MKYSVIKIICIVSGVLFAVLAIALVILAVQMRTTVNPASVGIIGGADGPTAIFLTQKLLRTPVFRGMFWSFLAFVGTGLALIVMKKKRV
jgi:Na+-transporting methylmalonyl-CoA/oxaloacetate decarboxylase beta subunit